LADVEETLRAAYRAFNAREVEAVLELMDPDVDWPNAWEGGRVRGRDAVREYWRRQFEQISGQLEPESFATREDGSVAVTVHQVVRPTGGGEPISDGRVLHRWWLRDDLVVRMDVEEIAGE